MRGLLRRARLIALAAGLALCALNASAFPPSLVVYAPQSAPPAQVTPSIVGNSGVCKWIGTSSICTLTLNILNNHDDAVVDIAYSGFQSTAAVACNDGQLYNNEGSSLFTANQTIVEVARLRNATAGVHTIVCTGSATAANSFGQAEAFDVTGDANLPVDGVSTNTQTNGSPTVGPTNALSSPKQIVFSILGGSPSPSLSGVTSPPTPGYSNLYLDTTDAVQATSFDSKTTNATTPVSANYGAIASQNWGAVVVTFQGGTSQGGGGGGTKIKWHPGIGGMSSAVAYTALGDKYNGNDMSAQKASEIAALHASIPQAYMYVGAYFWGALTNALDSGGNPIIDGSQAGSGLDIDYANTTGYVSGSQGSAVYNNPRRFGIFIFTGDFFSDDPTKNNVCPAWVLNNPGTYGAGPLGSSLGGFWLTSGGSGTKEQAQAAYWRSSVATAFEATMKALANHVLPDGYTVDNSPYVELVWVMDQMSDQATGFDASGNALPAGPDPTYTSGGEAGFFTQTEAIMASANTSFAHTTTIINNNYSIAVANMVSLSNWMGGHRTAFGTGDTFGLTSGTNLPALDGMGGPTFAQLTFLGYQPTGNGYTTNWLTSGNTVWKGAVPMISNAATTEMITNYGIGPYSPTDIYNQMQFFGTTHASWNYSVGLTGIDARANWLGSATSQTQWNTAPGTWGGIEDLIFNKSLSNTSCPSQYVTAGGCNTNGLELFLLLCPWWRRRRAANDECFEQKAAA